MRRILMLVVVVGVALLAMGIGGAIAGRATHRAAERSTLDQRAQHQGQSLDHYVTQARAVVLVTAQNPAFQRFYAQHRERDTAVVDGMNAALEYLERLYPARIGEACFIDASGRENARVVRGVRAEPADLSEDEADTPFFAPTFALPAGEVYHTDPYVSPDTDEWVIANATRIPGRPAIVHFEATIESFRREASAGASGPVLVVDGHTGAVVMDSRYPQKIGTPLGVPGDRRFAALTGGWGESGRFSVNGTPGSYRRTAVSPSNANEWYVVALAPNRAGALDGVGTFPVVAIVVALLVLGLATVGLRRARTQLVSAARTDALTGLHNRRALDQDLRAAASGATGDRPAVLAMFDLNGFKAYNDTFGHPAGDALLARLGAALTMAVAGRARAYRLGGDEFCVLARIDRPAAGALVADAVRALTEQGEGFHIGAAHGVIVLPDDTDDPTEAIRLVDLRMYEQKSTSRVPADAQTSNALLRALQERDPGLSRRMELTARLADAVCARMGSTPGERNRIVQAARIHDIGKVAVPEAILDTPGPLGDTEWSFVRQAPTIGERIAAAAPALAPLAPLIRCVRERVDGLGYPDGLAGDDIPFGATVIAACSALAAMVSDRPHAPARDLGAALSELRRASGTQFAPAVVDELVRVAADVLHRSPV